MSTSNPSPAENTATAHWLAHFPITLFGATMGIFGLALALRAGDFPATSAVVTWAGAAMLVAFYALYALKALRYPAQVAAEWSHPVRLSFFPAANISILLLSLLLQNAMPTVSMVLWFRLS